MWQLNCSHVYSQAAADTIGATSPHVNVEQIKNFLLILPPPGEQEEISAWISRRTVSLDATIARARREIDLLREYRTRSSFSYYLYNYDLVHLVLPTEYHGGRVDLFEVLMDSFDQFLLVGHADSP